MNLDNGWIIHVGLVCMGIIVAIALAIHGNVQITKKHYIKLL